MATDTNNAGGSATLQALLSHPFAIYAQEFLQARTKVVTEISRLQAAADDGALGGDARAEARVRAQELNSELGHMDDANSVFMARVVIGPFQPRDDVVERTVKLNAALGQVTADANRAAAIVRLASEWAAAVAGLVEGQVAAA
jgi:hypothetical protein